MRNGIRHVHKAGYTTGYSRLTFRVHICFMSQPRITEMNMVVYNSRYQITTLCINSLITSFFRLAVCYKYFFNNIT